MFAFSLILLNVAVPLDFDRCQRFGGHQIVRDSQSAVWAPVNSELDFLSTPTGEHLHLFGLLFSPPGLEKRIARHGQCGVLDGDFGECIPWIYFLGPLSMDTFVFVGKRLLCRCCVDGRAAVAAHYGDHCLLYSFHLK